MMRSVRLLALASCVVAALQAPSHAAERGAADRVATPPPFARAAEVLASDSIAYRARVMDGNLVGVTITNYGFIGNNFISRAPSLEYPLGAGYEHLVRGGLWIGAIARDDVGVFTGVSTAAVDGAQGTASQGATEFTPAGNALQVRSSLLANDNYNPAAVSELDVISTFSDRPAKRADNNSEDHRPMGLIVRQENYSWSFSQYQHVNIFHYTIRNDGPPLKDVWVGLYGEFASGSKKDAAVWPPSGWFRKKWLAVDDTLTVARGDTIRAIPPMMREHYCTRLPIPDACELERAPYWVGAKLLGWKASAADTVAIKRYTFSGWDYQPFSNLRNEDVEKYGLISTGVLQPVAGDSLQPGGDPVTLFAVGPFSQIDPGDSIVVDFALVGGAEVADIQEHARFAQDAFDNNYVIPIPPPPPNIKVVARHEALDVYWDDTSELAIDPTSPVPQDFEGYRLYLGDERLELNRIGEWDKTTAPHDTTGFNTGFAAIRRDTVIDGRTYRYRYQIPNLRDGFKYFVSVTAFDLGNVRISSLESGISRNNKFLAIPSPAPGEQVAGDKVTVFPNPYRVEARWDQGQLVRDHYLWFANLPPTASIKIYTLAGDLVFETDFNGASYRGTDARGVFDPRRELDVQDIRLSGRSYAWNLITRQGQAAATGLYMYSVEDKQTGERQLGKFLIVKSDREGF
ncbi:MAG: hypothetical protein HOP12_14740 [Candidatus Eisenbacteria bacterium]|uniref:Fibronectin type III domain-containing protein n=1 Tax=Eiseniibacteriota bacterium TaxID=2212470 RepID=A0A849T286_UNCEI|nr:hypothetical protein [Candidatus Eisenbacteria bacterium]